MFTVVICCSKMARPTFNGFYIIVVCVVVLVALCVDYQLIPYSRHTLEGAILVWLFLLFSLSLSLFCLPASM